MLCVGLDPDPERIEGGAAGALRPCRYVVRQTEEHVCCFKPNSAFWEQYGPDGWSALMELRDAAPATPFLLDAKRGDMDNTMRAYANAVFGTLAMDAATVNPYLGSDSLREFTKYEDRGVYVLCRTSNPGATELQHLDTGGKPLYRHVVGLAERLNAKGNVGLVVGATAPAQVAEVRAATDLPFLVPGVGAQGGARGGGAARADQRRGRGAGMTEGRHSARLILQGHIIDSMMLPQVMDIVMDLGGNFTIEELKVGQHKTAPSRCRMEVYADSAGLLDRIVQRARALGATAEHEQPVRVDKVARAGVFPEGFYSTSNLPTEVLLDGRWVNVDNIEMDAAIAVDRKAHRAWCIVFQDAKPGMEVVIGHQGVRVTPLERSRQTEIFSR